jgi:hypothetical protein
MTRFSTNLFAALAAILITLLTMQQVTAVPSAAPAAQQQLA